MKVTITKADKIVRDEGNPKEVVLLKQAQKLYTQVAKLLHEAEKFKTRDSDISVYMDAKKLTKSLETAISGS